MDALQQTVVRLFEQGLSIKKIAVRTDSSEQKIRKILISLGLYTSEIAKNIADMTAQGMGIKQIADALGISQKAVQAHMPYIKGAYGKEYPSINALRIRKCRAKKVEKA